MSIKRSTLVLAGSLLLGTSAFASNRGNQGERFDTEQSYAGTQSGTMVPTAPSSQAIITPFHLNRADLRK